MLGVGTEAVALLRAQRIKALYRIIPRKEVKWALAQSGNRRSCPRLPDVFVFYFILALGLFCRDCYRQVFRWLRPWKKGATPGRSTLCEARRRLGLIPLVKLAGRVVKLLAHPETPGAFHRNLRLMAIDGFVMDVPDSKDNERVFGKPKGGRTPGAFPQARIVALCEAGTHVLWRWLIKPIRVSEQAMCDYLLRHLQAGMLLMWDRGFLSHDRVEQVIASGAHLLARVKKNLILQPIRHLSDNSYLAKLYRNAHDRKRDRNGIVVRVLDYELKDSSRVGHCERHRLITTLLDEKLDPAVTLIELYHVRWEQELAIEELKTYEGRPVLRSQTPAGVVQELYAFLVDHFVVRTLMFEAAKEAKASPLSISFTGALKILRCRIPECPRKKKALKKWWRKLVGEVAEEVLPPRRNRINPRVIKRKMSKWPKKKPEHRNCPQPKSQFIDTIELLH